jgi:hypothetical protein
MPILPEMFPAGGRPVTLCAGYIAAALPPQKRAARRVLAENTHHASTELRHYIDFK